MYALEEILAAPLTVPGKDNQGPLFSITKIGLDEEDRSET